MNPVNVRNFNPMGHDTPGLDLLGLSMLAAEVIKDGRDDFMVEVGSWAGLTALTLAQHGKVYCVDHWKGSTSDDRITALAAEVGSGLALQTFCRNARGLLFDRIVPCRGASDEWAPIFREWKKQAALIFLDASHDAESLSHDIDAWLPVVKKDGILCGHDYGVFPGVAEAVESKLKGRAISILPGGRIWWVKKLE